MFGLFFFVGIADSKGILLYSTRNLLKGTQPGLFRSNNRQKETHYQPNWAMMIIASIPRSEWRLMQKIIYKTLSACRLISVAFDWGTSSTGLRFTSQALRYGDTAPNPLTYLSENELKSGAPRIVNWRGWQWLQWQADRTEILLVRCVMRWYPVYGIPAHIFI